MVPVPRGATVLGTPMICIRMTSGAPSATYTLPVARISGLATSRPKSEVFLWYSSLSVELRYFAGLFSERSRHVQPSIWLVRLRMGMVMRLRKKL